MCKVRLNLDRPDKFGFCPVRIKFTYNNQRKFYNIREKIRRKDIDQTQYKQGKLRIKNSLTEGLQVNTHLEQVESKAREIIRDFIMLHKPYSLKDVCDKFEEWLNPGRNITDWNDVFDLWIKDLESKNKPQTVKAIKVIRHWIELPGNFNGLFIDRFLDTMIEKGMEVQTIKKRLSWLKEFIKFGQKHGFSDDFLKWKPKKKLQGIRKEKTYLTKEEYSLIFNAELTGHLDKIRDILIVLYNTGQQHIDTKITNVHVKDGMLNSFRQKTGNRYKLPVSSDLQTIFDKYNGAVPFISNQKTNEGLKELFTHLNIIRPVRIEFNKAGLKYFEVRPFNEVVTSKMVGRNAMLTNLNEAKISPSIIKEIAGQTDISAQDAYTSMSEQIREDIKESYQRKK